MNHLPLHCRIMRKTRLSNLTSLPHLIKTAMPNWFGRRPFDVFNFSIRFGIHLGSKGPLRTALSVQRSDGYALLMSPNKGETAVHGCHCRGDMVLRMLKVMAIPRSWYVCFCAVTLVLVSLCNRTVERGRQNGCSAVVLTKYQGFFSAFTKRSVKWKMKFEAIFFKQNYCLACYTRFNLPSSFLIFYYNFNI